MTLVLKPFEIFQKRLESGQLGLLERHESWEVKPLGQLIELINGAPFDSSLFNRVESGKPLIRIRDVGKANTETWFSGAYDEKYLVQAGEILVGLDGDFRVAEWHGPEALLNQRVCKLVVDASVLDKKFMLYHLQGWLDAIWEETSATTVKHLSSKSIQEIPFPCPPLDEQRRIVETLDNHLSRLDKAVADLGHADSQTLAFRRSILNTLVNSEVIDSGTGTEGMTQSRKKWMKTTLGKVANLQKGMTITAKSARAGSVPVIAGGKSPAYFHAEANRPSKTITVSASGAYAGYVAFHAEPIWASDCVTAVPTNLEICTPEFLHYFMLSKQNEIYGLQRGSGMPHVYAKDLALLEIAIPPLDDQRQIVETLDGYLSRLDSARESIAIQKVWLSTLRRSILNKAFNGELGSN